MDGIGSTLQWRNYAIFLRGRHTSFHISYEWDGNRFGRMRVKISNPTCPQAERFQTQVFCARVEFYCQLSTAVLYRLGRFVDVLSTFLCKKSKKGKYQLNIGNLQSAESKKHFVLIVNYCIDETIHDVEKT